MDCLDLVLGPVFNLCPSGDGVQGFIDFQSAADEAVVTRIPILGKMGKVKVP